MNGDEKNWPYASSSRLPRRADEIVIDGAVYLSASRAREISGYTSDYIGQMCREGRVEARRMGKSWFLERSSFLSYLGAHGIGSQHPHHANAPHPSPHPSDADAAIRELGWGDTTVSIPQEDSARPLRGEQEAKVSDPPVSPARQNAGAYLPGLKIAGAAFALSGVFLSAFFFFESAAGKAYVASAHSALASLPARAEASGRGIVLLGREIADETKGIAASIASAERSGLSSLRETASLAVEDFYVRSSRGLSLLSSSAGERAAAIAGGAGEFLSASETFSEELWRNYEDAALALVASPFWATDLILRLSSAGIERAADSLALAAPLLGSVRERAAAFGDTASLGAAVVADGIADISRAGLEHISRELDSASRAALRHAALVASGYRVTLAGAEELFERSRRQPASILDAVNGLSRAVYDRVNATVEVLAGRLGGEGAETPRPADEPGGVAADAESGEPDKTATAPPASSGEVARESVPRERVIERVVTLSGVTAATLEERLRELRDEFSLGLSGLAAATDARFSSTNAAIAHTNKIDRITNVAVSNVAGLTDADIPDSITVSAYLPLSGGTLTGALTLTSATGTDLAVTNTATTSELVVSNLFTFEGAATSTFAGPLLLSGVPGAPHSFSSWAVDDPNASALASSLIVNPASAAADTNLFALAVAGNAKFLVDAEGDVFGNSLTVVGGTTLSTTTASTFSVENNTTLGDATTTDQVFFNSRIGTSLIPTATNLLDLGDTANGLAWRTGIFGTSLGVGTTSPYAALSVVGEAVAEFFTATSSEATSTILGFLGVGTSTPSTRLSVADTISEAQVRIAYDTSRYADLQVNSVGDLIVNPQGDDVFLNDDNLFVCTGGSCPANTPSGTGNIIVENRLGVGTTTPTEQLAVTGNLFVGNDGAATLGTATSTFAGDITILGKLDVSTIDPVYTIGGVKYATYGHATVGVKEEVVANVALATLNPRTGRYESAIVFPEEAPASDLWLFWQITDFGPSFERLVVSLTPGFDGRVFYEKRPAEKTLLIASDRPGEVGVRLIADRFDASQWGNVRADQDGWGGFELDLKE